MATKMERAKQFRALAMMNAEILSDDQAATVPTLYPEWREGEAVAVGARRYYQPEDKLYKCLQDHTTQADWTPDVSPSLWVRIDDPAIEWPDWIQPTGSTDAYPLGAKVTHNEKRWTSDVDANVWEPGVANWTEVTE